MASEAVKLMDGHIYFGFWNRHQDEQLFSPSFGMVWDPLQRGAKVSNVLCLMQSMRLTYSTFRVQLIANDTPMPTHIGLMLPSDTIDR